MEEHRQASCNPATKGSRVSAAWTQWYCDIDATTNYRIKANYINIRSLGMIQTFLWHELHTENTLERLGWVVRETLLLPTPLAPLLERELCSRNTSMLLESKQGYNKIHLILEQILLFFQGAAKDLQQEEVQRTVSSDQNSPLISCHLPGWPPGTAPLLSSCWPEGGFPLHIADGVHKNCSDTWGCQKVEEINHSAFTSQFSHHRQRFAAFFP